MLRSGSSSRRYWALVIAGLFLIMALRAPADEPVICPSSANNLTHASTPATPAPRIGIVTTTHAYPLREANTALADLRAGRFDGAAVLVP